MSPSSTSSSPPLRPTTVMNTARHVKTTTTCLQIADMHCQTCVAAITANIDRACHPYGPIDVRASLDDRTITIEHAMAAPLKAIASAVEDCGFRVEGAILGAGGENPVLIPEIHSAREAEWSAKLLISNVSRWAARSNSRSAKQWLNPLKKATDPTNESDNRWKRHLMSCKQCQQSVASRPTARRTPTEHPEQPEDLDRQWTIEVAIEGMTCSSCTNAITRSLQSLECVKSISVSLIDHGATIDFTGLKSDCIPKIVEAIEDCGFDTLTGEAKPLLSEDEKAAQKASMSTASPEARIAEIDVDGIFCPACPPKIASTLENLQCGIEILQLSTPDSPLLRIRYTPAPGVNIRVILAAIEGADQAFKASLHQPLSWAERSKLLQHRQRLALIARLALAFAVAIPCFTLEVVYLSLVTQANATRLWLLTPTSVGVTRVEWILLVLSTPVYFWSASVFHTKMLRELWTLWRPGSSTPLLRRVYCFGSMNTLVSIATSIAYWASIAETIVMAVTNAEKEQATMDSYFGEIVFIITFLLAGRIIEAFSKAKTGETIQALSSLRPSSALLVECSAFEPNAGGKSHPASMPVREIALGLIDVGDLVRIPHGTSPPCDGVLLADTKSSFVRMDESTLTGESRTVTKAPGDFVYAGTINSSASAITLRVIKRPGSSLLDDIISIVRSGQSKRAPIERIADRITSYFVPFICFLGLLVWLLWMILGYAGSLPSSYLDVSTGGWAYWSLSFAISVFVIACPCGIGLAAPTALFVGTGIAARHGILARGGGTAFEEASKLDCIVFDKTGTLTFGKEPLVVDKWLKTEGMEVEDKMSHSQVQVMLASLERASSHPVAKALLAHCSQSDHAQDLKLATPAMISNEEVPGRGMKGHFRIGQQSDIELIVGNERFMMEHGVFIDPEATSLLTTWSQQAYTVVLVATRVNKQRCSTTLEWRLIASFAVSDPVRPEAPSVVRYLQHDRGIAVWMLSGDNALTAEAVALKVGIPPERVIAGVLPEGKADKIKELQEGGLSARCTSGTSRKSFSCLRFLPFQCRPKCQQRCPRRQIVAMVGDGINDSAALTVADVGISLGSGTDVALTSSDFILLGGSSTSNATSNRSSLEAASNDSVVLMSLPLLLSLSHTLFRRVKFNFFYALVYNCLAIPIAAGVFYPVGVKLSMTWASLAMALSSISVVGSSLALNSNWSGLGFKKPELEMDVPRG